MNNCFADYLKDCKTRTDQALKKNLGDFTSVYTPHNSLTLLPRLQEAMRYSLLNGGKRVRPILVYAAAQAISQHSDVDNETAQTLDQIACSVEMIHSYSLIHDDLPAMDDDDLRRGAPTCHRAFDEATAILAGDALQARAFELLTEVNCSAQIQIKLLQTLSRASGAQGMVGGQAIDLAAVNQQIDMTHLETIHHLKTGALIRAAVAMGGIFSLATEQQMTSLDTYAQAIGLSFQVQDDILDIESDTTTLGKQQGSDIALNKPTYPALLGMDGAKQKALDLHQEALDALSNFSCTADRLRELSAYIIARKH